MRQRIIGALVAFVLMLTGVASASEAAKAEPKPIPSSSQQLADPGDYPGYDCPYVNSPYDAMCAYENTNATGPMEFWYPSVPRNTCTRLERSATAVTRSIYNRTNYVWRAFRTLRCDGSHIAINPYTYYANLPSGWSGAVVAFSRTSTTS